MLMSNILNPFFLKLSFHKCFNSTLQLTACLLVASPTIFFSLSLNISLSPLFLCKQHRSPQDQLRLSFQGSATHPTETQLGSRAPASDVEVGLGRLQMSRRLSCLSGFAALQGWICDGFLISVLSSMLVVWVSSRLLFLASEVISVLFFGSFVVR